MRNLKLVKHYYYQDDCFADAELFCVDSDKKAVYFINQDCIYKLDLLSSQICCSKINEGFSSTDSQITIVGAAYLFIEQSLCLATSSGDIVTFNTTCEELECVGTVENGIKAMSWSPDQEIVVIVTGSNSLILMNHDFDTICESPIHSGSFGENAPITVGWGKKETQFHGSEGKAAAKVKFQPTQTIFPFDDRKTRVSWRGDGQFFVINSVMPDSEIRQLRVWNREGVVQYSSEPLNGVEQALHWQPSGCLITSSLRKPNKHELAFFEKNCLPHGEFTLPFAPKQVKVNEVMWNCDSSLLAILAEDLTLDVVEVDGQLNSVDVNSYLQIWTVNNFHWYLKQSFSSSPSTFSHIRAMLWDPENANQLHVFCSGGLYFNFVWSWDINCSRGTTADDIGIVGVIDGAHLLVTPFRNLVVPPPLSAFTFNLPKAINQVLNAPHSKSNDIMVVMEGYKFAVFSTDCTDTNDTIAAIHLGASGGNGFKPQFRPHCLKGIFELRGAENLELVDLSIFHHWVWVNCSTLLATCTLKSNNNTSGLVQVCCNMDSGNSGYFTVEKFVPVENQVILITALPSEVGVAIELSDGSLFTYICGSNSISPWLKKDGTRLKLSQPCYNVKIIRIDSTDYVLSLSNTCSLYINDLELANNCTSFYFGNSFLLFTTQSHELHCLTKHLLQEEAADLRKKSVMIEQLRNVERGSSIVTVISFDTKVIFQMPRGNLETIHPRPLVIHLIWQYLSRLLYKEALLLMRKHRINMNLLFDHSPELFINNVDKFLSQMEDISWINLFLSSLQDCDVTSTLYKTIYTALEYGSERLCKEDHSKNKVDLVCDVMLQAMENLNTNKYFLGIMTAHAKKSKPELDIALQKIMALRDRNLNADTNEMSTDMALNHLLYLVDVNDLFNVALGTYDFDLVILVAEKSQKDPKEYLPFLNSLQKHDDNYRRYCIDKYLRRYSKALVHISKCGDEHFEECLTLIHSNNLYSEALKVFPKTSKHYQIILDAYGNHLLEKNNYEEAGILFMKGHFYQKALSAFKKSGNWKLGFSAALKMNYSPTDLIPLAREFSGLLKSSKNFIDASHVLDVYAMDHEESVAALVEGCEWERSLLMMHRYQRLDMLESHLFTAMMDNYTYLSATYDTLKSTFERHKKRLIIVRTEKQSRIQQLSDDETNDFNNKADLFSDASTVTGMVSTVLSGRSGSRFTSRTSRNKRKHNRKKVTLKKGSPFEDIALLESLTAIIQQVDNMKADSGSLIRALVLHGFEREAAKLQLQLDEFIKYIFTCKSEIWPAEESQETDQTLKAGPLSTVSSILSTVRQTFNTNRSIPVEYQHFLHPPSLKHDVSWKMDNLKLALSKFAQF